MARSSSPRALPGALVLVALLGACAARQPPRTPEEMPAWRTEQGRKDVWRELARWYIDNGQPEEALEMVQRLREAREDTTELRLIQGRALAAQGVPDEARLVLEAIAKDHPRSHEAWSALGVVYVDLDETERALAAFKRSLQLRDLPTTRNNLGFLLLAEGRCDEAAEHLEVATAEDSTNARYRNNLAFSLVCTGDFTRALKLFRSTMPSEAEARFNMGVAYERLDKLPSAILQYREALVADPQHQGATEALARLEQSVVSPGVQ